MIVKVTQSFDKLLPRQLLVYIRPSHTQDCVSLKSTSAMQTYYHYTTPDSAEAIRRSGVIKMSVQNVRGRRDDAVYGSGVYLTKVPPSTAKELIAKNNYDGLTPHIAHVVNSGTSSYNKFPVSKSFCRAVDVRS